MAAAAWMAVAVAVAVAVVWAAAVVAAARRAAPRCRARFSARARGVGRATGVRSCTRPIRCRGGGRQQRGSVMIQHTIETLTSTVPTKSILTRIHNQRDSLGKLISSMWGNSICLLTSSIIIYFIPSFAECSRTRASGNAAAVSRVQDGAARVRADSANTKERPLLRALCVWQRITL